MCSHADNFDWDDTSEVRPRPSSPELSADAPLLLALEELARSRSGRRARVLGVRLKASLGERGDELAGLLDALVTRAEELERVRREASRDPLTGLANRRSFSEALKRELARARRASRPLSVLLFDLDGLKIINDSRGHGAGDDALREVAARAQQTVRSGDLVARLGGDEFVVLLPDTGGQEAAAIGERTREQLAALGLGISFGIATCHGRGPEARELLESADRALYRDKVARKTLRPSAV